MHSLTHAWLLCLLPQMRAESSRLTAQATELVQAGRKDRALLVLKMRRLREEESQKAEGQLLNVEKLVRGVGLPSRA